MKRALAAIAIAVGIAGCGAGNPTKQQAQQAVAQLQQPAPAATSTPASQPTAPAVTAPAQPSYNQVVAQPIPAGPTKACWAAQSRGYAKRNGMDDYILNASIVAHYQQGYPWPVEPAKPSIGKWAADMVKLCGPLS